MVKVMSGELASIDALCQLRSTALQLRRRPVRRIILNEQRPGRRHYDGSSPCFWDILDHASGNHFSTGVGVKFYHVT